MGNNEYNLTSEIFTQQAEQMNHRDYEDEMFIYNLVAKGLVEELKNQKSGLCDPGLGKLSSNNIRNVQYHFAIGTAICSRFCIEAGLNLETAYTMSDLFIRKADLMNSIEEISALHKEMLLAYANKMNMLNNTKNYSHHVKQVLEYIDNHLHTPLSITDISDALFLNKSYLCTLFRKETGITIGNYIEEKRIHLAMTYLTDTNFSYTEIYQHLCFSSQSHFSKTFKKRTGMTPGEYRKKYYRKSVGTTLSQEAP